MGDLGCGEFGGQLHSNQLNLILPEGHRLESILGNELQSPETYGILLWQANYF